MRVPHMYLLGFALCAACGVLRAQDIQQDLQADADAAKAVEASAAEKGASESEQTENAGEKSSPKPENIDPESVVQTKAGDEKPASTVEPASSQEAEPQSESGTVVGGSGAVVDEEDILLIEGEGEESILAEEVGVHEQEPVEEAAAADSAGQKTSGIEPAVEPRPETGASPGAAPAAAAQAEFVDTSADKKPATIERARSINFAKNLKEYRSPRTALFLSLLVPGLGQAYAKKYVKTAIFGVAEAAIIGVGVNFALKGMDVKQEARDFADQHYDINRFWTYYSDVGELIQTQTTLPDSPDVRDIKQTIIWDSTEFAQDAASRNNEYYESLERQAMVQGWADCEPRIDPVDLVFIDNDTSYSYTYAPHGAPGTGNDTVWLVYQIDKTLGDTIGSYMYGYSDLQRQYIGKLRTSNNYYRVSSSVLFLLIANHLISAVDAMISAKAHNDELLGRETFWQRINLEQQVAYNGSHIIGTFGVRIRF